MPGEDGGARGRVPWLCSQGPSDHPLMLLLPPSLPQGHLSLRFDQLVIFIPDKYPAQKKDGVSFNRGLNSTVKFD